MHLDQVVYLPLDSHIFDLFPWATKVVIIKKQINIFTPHFLFLYNYHRLPINKPVRAKRREMLPKNGLSGKIKRRTGNATSAEQGLCAHPLAQFPGAASLLNADHLCLVLGRASQPGTHHFWLRSPNHLQPTYKVRVHMELSTEIISKCYS